MTARKKMVLVVALGAGLAGPTGAYTQAAYMDAVLSHDPINYWRLGESSGTTAFDLVGEQHGTYHNGMGLGEPGLLPDDTAARFYTNHRPGYVEVPHADSLLLDDGTISFWFMDTGTLSQAGLFSKDSSNYDTGGHLTMYTDSSRFNVRLQSTSASHFVESDPIQLDTWYNAVFTFGDEGMNLYMNGVLVDTDPYAGGLGTTSGGTGNFEPLVFGANSWGSGNLVSTPLKEYFSGVIDEVVIFDDALTGQEIGSLYQAGIPEPVTLSLMLIGALAMLRTGTRRTAKA